MSGVWMFRNDGVYHLIENPQGEDEGGRGRSRSGRRKALVHLPSGEAITSYSTLHPILKGLGWERYNSSNNTDLIQYHRHDSIDLISLPRDFSKFNSVYMYDIVIKTPNVFHVRDV